MAATLVIGVILVMPAMLALLPGSKGLEWTIRIVGYLAMLFVVVAGVGALYRWGPSREEARWRWITPGTILAVVATGITSVLFSWYVGNFADYNATYGSLGALIGLLTWLWLTVTIVIFDAELNSEVEHQTGRDSTTGPELPLGERGAHMADTVGRVWPLDRGKVEGEPATKSHKRFSWGAFASRVTADGHLSTRRYARLVDEWVTAIGLTPQEYGNHSLRPTKASIIYKATGNLRAIQILLGHSKIEKHSSVPGRGSRRRSLAVRGHRNLILSDSQTTIRVPSVKRPFLPFRPPLRLPES